MADTPSTSSWLYGRGLDLAIGCGGLYVLSLPALFAISASTGLARWPVALVVVLGLTINAPHYGATLVRLYERREDRIKYVFFTVYVTIALLLLFVTATRQDWLSSVLITAFFTWSPWHFSAQNYGLVAMFLGREGVAIDAVTKRLLYASFVFSTLIAIENVQATATPSAVIFAPGTFRGPDMPRLLLSPFLRENAFVILASTTLLYVGTLGAALSRIGAAGRRSGPVATLLVTQAFFTAVPVFSRRFFETGEIQFVFASAWLSMAHSAQYLWVSAYFAKRAEGRQTTPRFLWKSFLAGSGVTVLPGLLFAPTLLGTRPFDAGLAALVFAVVNLHHFIMDGAIWKLRDGRVSGILLRSAASDSPSRDADRRPRRRLASLVWTLCALSVAIPLVELYEERIGIPGARDSSRIALAFERLRWVGREKLSTHLLVGAKFRELGQYDAARSHFRRSLELHPSPHAWVGLGDLARRERRLEDARLAYDEARSLAPRFAAAVVGAVKVRALDPAQPRPDDLRDARAILDEMLEVHPDWAEGLDLRLRIGGVAIDESLAPAP